MKPCSSSCANVSKRQKAATNYVSGWRLSIRSRILVNGKDDAPAIEDCAKISSISVGAQSSTICMSWLVPSSFLLSFRMLLDFLTDALGNVDAEVDEELDLATLPALEEYR
jgi:hypothetical protein